ncbi:hypothetical protein BY996DRAFT_6483449 [Phakopsora pachyrhizi]|uniref:Uncharacterized protein n=1 Tax=Phakopsora pachyrhizi TaxID=170000 RepID=A0AAV0AMR7_PHAPC|nr:hypothetical protein BY996DRAFT_6483449 [Phakopsora pachyrhizi]CAH7669546.1 hypothetical protein PPACK8108_LOCUS4177 [Phakopsora pachyrhizi]
MALWAGHSKAVPAGPGRDGWERNRRMRQAEVGLDAKGLLAKAGLNRDDLGRGSYG